MVESRTWHPFPPNPLSFFIPLLKTRESPYLDVALVKKRKSNGPVPDLRRLLPGRGTQSLGASDFSR